ncbi:MAG: pantoate--beta-alanine ligase [Clostridiales bacterium]|nr:pantoate--beta-alanine ligase [Clostridiales bacterium]
MILVEEKNKTREIIKEWKSKGYSIGFIPTMGYLHRGHLSLMEKARRENDKLVVSIFVNPIQFGPNEDYDKYPRDMAGDIEMCKSVNVDLIFAPSVSDMYKTSNQVYVDVEKLGDVLCGAKREGHFRGVSTVVAKLFNIISPDKAYFGEKDYQQLVIIKKMVDDLDFDLEIIPCAIVREEDGLAISSRNSYLSREERKAALILAESLSRARQAMIGGERDVSIIKNIITNELSQEPLAVIDYVELVDAIELRPVARVSERILVAVAVFIGKTRLIDNFIFEA